VIEDYAKAVTPALKGEGNPLVLLGERRGGLGGSAYARHLGWRGGPAPSVVFSEVREQIAGVLDGIERGWIVACHDISEGGLAAAVAEMVLCGLSGARLEIEEMPGGLRWDEILFDETGGFVCEVDRDHRDRFLSACRGRVSAWVVGEVGRPGQLTVRASGLETVTLDLDRLRGRWSGALKEALR
jgi:phosphoribosylformylglycinamidine synthase